MYRCERKFKEQCSTPWAIVQAGSNTGRACCEASFVMSTHGLCADQLNRCSWDPQQVHHRSGRPLLHKHTHSYLAKLNHDFQQQSCTQTRIDTQQMRTHMSARITHNTHAHAHTQTHMRVCVGTGRDVTLATRTCAHICRCHPWAWPRAAPRGSRSWTRPTSAPWPSCKALPAWWHRRQRSLWPLRQVRGHAHASLAHKRSVALLGAQLCSRPQVLPPFIMPVNALRIPLPCCRHLLAHPPLC